MGYVNFWNYKIRREKNETLFIMIDIILASNNSGKLAEMRGILDEESYNIKTPVEFGLGSPEETGMTVVENSIIKARHAALHTCVPSIADDSGLCIPDRRRGVYLDYRSGIFLPASAQENEVAHPRLFPHVRLYRKPLHRWRESFHTKPRPEL